MQSVANHLTLLFYLQALRSGTKNVSHDGWLPD